LGERVLRVLNIIIRAIERDGDGVIFRGGAHGYSFPHSGTTVPGQQLPVNYPRNETMFNFYGVLTCLECAQNTGRKKTQIRRGEVERLRFVESRSIERACHGRRDQEEGSVDLPPAERVRQEWRTLDLLAKQESEAPQGKPWSLGKTGRSNIELNLDSAALWHRPR
jgi:hypothetical protein